MGLLGQIQVLEQIMAILMRLQTLADTGNEGIFSWSGGAGGSYAISSGRNK